MTNESGTRSELKGKSSVGPSHQQGFKEEISMESLSKQALAETIREGGAFARESSDQFKQ